MRTRFAVAAALLFAFSCAAAPQDKSAAQDDRSVLEQILIQTYQPSLVGKQLLGVGAENGVRRAGTIVVIQREGLYGSYLHTEPASSSIHGDKAELFRGHKDYPVPVGERFYVTGLKVGSDTVFIGLLSARRIVATGGNDRVWTSVSFNFRPEILATANKEEVFRAIDPWFVPEGRIASDTRPVISSAPAAPAPVSAPYQQAAAPAPVAAPLPQPRPAPAAPANLAPGMPRDQVLQLLGAPLREVTFDQRSWLTYPVLTVVLKDGKVDSVEPTNQSTGKLTMFSEPAGAEILLDGQLVGSTTSTLIVPSGMHNIRLQSPGYKDWIRDLQVLAGSEINLHAQLEKN